MPNNPISDAVNDFNQNLSMREAAIARTVPDTLSDTHLAALAVLTTLGHVTRHNRLIKGKTTSAVSPVAIGSVLDALESSLAWVQEVAGRAAGAAKAKQLLRLTGGGEIVFDKIDALATLFTYICVKRPALSGQLAVLATWFRPWRTKLLEIAEAETYTPELLGELVNLAKRSRVDAGEDAALKRLIDAMDREEILKMDGSVASATPEVAPSSPSSSGTSDGAAVASLVSAYVAGGMDAETATASAERVIRAAHNRNPGDIQADLADQRFASAIANTYAAITGQAPPRPTTASVSKPGGFGAKYPGVNHEQAAIIDAPEPVIHVPAAAGSGKTRTVTTKIKSLIEDHGVNPSLIRIVAFNNHAAEEIKTRLGSMIGADNAASVQPMTTHRFTAKYLREFGTMYAEGLANNVDPDSPTKSRTGAWLPSGSQMLYAAYESACDRLDVEPGTDYKINTVVARQFIDRYKNDGLSMTEYLEGFMSTLNNADAPEDAGRVLFLGCVLLLYEEQKGLVARERERFGERFDKVYDAYMRPPTSEEEEAKWKTALDGATDNGRASIRFDYSDWIAECYEAITPQPYDGERDRRVKADRLAKMRAESQYLIVDEAQDLAPVQIRMFGMIGGNRKLGEGQYIQVGDDAQSIYGFRGATPEEFVAQASSASTRRLDISTNYRSRSEIVEAADRVINQNTVQLRKSTTAALGPGGSIQAWQVPDYESLAAQVVGQIKQSLREPGSDEDRYLDAQGRPKCAIICRTRRELDEFEDELAMQGVEYVRRGGIPFWLKSDVGAVIGMLALAFCRAGTLKLSAKDQLAFMGRVMAYPHRPGSASGGEPIYMKPVVSQADPLAYIKTIKRDDEVFYTAKSGKTTRAGDTFAALSRDLDKIAAAAPDLEAMFNAMLKGESKGYDNQTLADMLVRATADSMTTDEMSPEDAAGFDAGSPRTAGVSVFGKLARFADINGFTGNPSGLVDALVSATQRAVQRRESSGGRYGRQRAKQQGATEAVVLSTIHMTKGLEYDRVFLVASSHNFPAMVFPNDHVLANPQRVKAYEGGLAQMKLEEERRLMYVAMTRAVNRLDVYAPDKTPSGAEAGPSRFIAEAGLEIQKAEEDPTIAESVSFSRRLFASYAGHGIETVTG